MKTADAIQRLAEHQTEILAIIARAQDIVGNSGEDVRAPLAKTRWTLARTLRAYQIFKHHEIFDPAMAHGSPAQVALARAMKARCVAAGDAFRVYAVRWSSTDVVRDWDRYKPAMLEMTQRLIDHVGRERRDIDRLLAGSDHTRRLKA